MDNSVKHSSIVDCWGLASLSISTFTHSLSLFLYHTFSVFSTDSFFKDFSLTIDARGLTITWQLVTNQGWPMETDFKMLQIKRIVIGQIKYASITVSIQYLAFQEYY